MYRMPDPVTRRRQAGVAQVGRAIAAARCAVRLAGLRTGDFAVRELLLNVIDELDRAERAFASLVSTSSRDGAA